MGKPKKLFRCHDWLQSTGTDEFDRSTGTVVRVSIHAFNVVKVTPKGYWLDYVNRRMGRWVAKKGKKRYAHETKDEAIKAFKRRKSRQIFILNERLEHAREALALEPEKYLDCTKPFTTPVF